MNRSNYTVYSVTNPVEGGWENLRELCKQILASGIKIIQLRDKHASNEELTRQATELRHLVDQYGAYLIINDQVEVARAAGAHGVHLGQADMPIAEARKLLGETAIIGASVRTPEEARAAEAAGASYLGANGIFESKTKTDLPGPPLGLEGLVKLRAASSLPLIAIGGITSENAAEVVEAGADGVAVISAILQAENIHEACVALRQEVNKGIALRREREEGEGLKRK